MTERRRGEKPRMSICQILDNMQHVADEKYRGNLQDNLFIIFNSLTIGDKKTFLRKSLMLHWKNQIELARGGLQEVVIDEDVRIDQESVTEERSQVNDVDYAESEKLKTWLLKAIFVIAALAFIGIVGLTYMTSSKDVSMNEMLKHLLDLFKLLV